MIESVFMVKTPVLQWLDFKVLGWEIFGLFQSSRTP